MILDLRERRNYALRLRGEYSKVQPRPEQMSCLDHPVAMDAEHRAEGMGLGSQTRVGDQRGEHETAAKRSIGIERN